MFNRYKTKKEEVVKSIPSVELMNKVLASGMDGGCIVGDKVVIRFMFTVKKAYGESLFLPAELMQIRNLLEQRKIQLKIKGGSYQSSDPSEYGRNFESDTDWVIHMTKNDFIDVLNNIYSKDVPTLKAAP